MTKLSLHRRLSIGDYKRHDVRVWYGSQRKKILHLISDNCIVSHAPTEQKKHGFLQIFKEGYGVYISVRQQIESIEFSSGAFFFAYGSFFI